VVTASAIGAGARHSAARGGLHAAALDDVRADLDQLLYLCRSAEAELDAAEVELDGAALHGATRELLARQLACARDRYRVTGRRLLSLRALAGSAAPSPALLNELSAERRSLADLLRAEQGLLAALVGAADWQSPSFLHSTLPAAGRQNGRIRPHWNDYKRDRHLDGDVYERRYLRAMVDGPAGLRALLTSCGMSAFTTVLSCLQLEGKLDGPVVAGAGLYHESRLLLEKALPGRVRLADEADERTLLGAIDERQPGAVFLDSLSNTKWMPVPDLAAVVEHLRGRETYLVVDNTGLSVSCQPFALARESVRLIVVESLLKYAQLGLDRANAGVIVARGDDAELLARYREHLGTNVADVAVHALPRPDRAVLERRLARLQRNALILAYRLRNRAPASVEIVYPGLPGHSCARASRRLPFHGACLSIVFRDGDRSLRRERALVEAAVAEAGRSGIALLGGSSFGFDTTRIYLTAANAELGEPFVRVAAGAEHRLEVEALAAALAAAVDEVA
jgi:cystathionine beta-lyase/cystathionine gamma-synthase